MSVSRAEELYLNLGNPFEKHSFFPALVHQLSGSKVKPINPTIYLYIIDIIKWEMLHP